MTKWLLSAALILSAFPSTTIAQTKESLVGTWKLVSVTVTNEKGEVKDVFGPNPEGFIAITADGGMSIIMTRSGRKPLSSTTDASTEEKAQAFSTSLAYAGHYTLRDDKMIIHIEACTAPNFVNTDDTRHVKIEGNRLTMLWYFDKDGRAPYYEYIWERLKPETAGK